MFSSFNSILHLSFAHSKCSEKNNTHKKTVLYVTIIQIANEALARQRGKQIEMRRPESHKRADGKVVAVHFTASFTFPDILYGKCQWQGGHPERLEWW